MKCRTLVVLLAAAIAAFASAANAGSAISPEKLKTLIDYTAKSNQPSTMPGFVATGLGLHDPFQSNIVSLDPQQLVHSFGVGVTEPVIIFIHRLNARELHVYTATMEGEMIAAGVIVPSSFIPVQAESMRGEFEQELQLWSNAEFPAAGETPKQ